MSNSPVRGGAVFPALVLLCAGSTNALAEETARERAGRMVEEIVVTARMRAEDLQDAPIAISAYSGEALDYRGVQRLDDVARFVPSLTLENNPSFGGASNSAAIYLRGIGQKEFLPTTEPGVGLYVDGVYVARSVGAILDIVDIERLEVLRGPQGTLFGRNTIGGAISVTTVKPQPGGEFEGHVSVTGGTDDLRRIKGALHIPVSETLAARVTAASLKQDGYVKRSDGIDLGDEDTLTGRIALAFEPNDRFAGDFTFEATRRRENGPALRLLDIDFTDLSQLEGVVAAPPPPMAFIHNVTVGATAPGVPCAATDPAGNGVTFNPDAPNCFDARYIGTEGRNEGTAPAFSKSDLYAASATLSYELTPTTTLKSITAWRDLDASFARDGDHSPHRIAQYFDDLEQTQFTQELQLIGSQERMNWIVGFYYFEEDGDNVNILDFTVSNFQSGGEFDNRSWAGFAQLSYDVTERLQVTAGGRYTNERKSFLPQQVIFQNYFAGISEAVPPDNPLAALDAPFLQAGEPILPPVEKRISIKEFTPMVSVSYDLSDEVMLYASYSEGFKSGGFTQRVFPPVVAGFTAPPGTPDIDLIPTYDPEFVEAYELGFKSRLLDRRVRFNGALFWTDYEDLQVQVFNSVAPVTENIGKATIKGVELELQAAPGDGWLIDASLAWIDAGYDRIDTELTLIGENFDFERVPDFTASLGLSKAFDVAEFGEFVARVDWSYRASTYNDAFNSPQLRSGSYHLVDASLRWHSPSRAWSAVLSGRNLGDKQYLITGIHGTAFQVYEGVFDRGRQLLLELRRDF